MFLILGARQERCCSSHLDCASRRFWGSNALDMDANRVERAEGGEGVQEMYCCWLRLNFVFRCKIFLQTSDA